MPRSGTKRRTRKALRSLDDIDIASGHKSHNRSKVTNGKRLLPRIDGRSVIARRYRDIAGALIVDQGGEELCTESRIQLIRRFAAAAVIAEQMEASLVRGEDIDITQHALLCNTLIRVAARIGIDRRSKNVTPALRDYLEAKTIEASG